MHFYSNAGGAGSCSDARPALRAVTPALIPHLADPQNTCPIRLGSTATDITVSDQVTNQPTPKARLQ